MRNVSTAQHSAAAVPLSTPNETVIVAVGAEGGDVKLLGRREAEGAWMFCRVTNDSSSASPNAETNSEHTVPIPVWVSTWDEAMTLLDRYPWERFRPLSVYGDFQAEVLEEVARRLLDLPRGRRDEHMAPWLAVCNFQRPP